MMVDTEELRTVLYDLDEITLGTVRRVDIEYNETVYVFKRGITTNAWYLDEIDQ